MKQKIQRIRHEFQAQMNPKPVLFSPKLQFFTNEKGRKD